MAPLISVLFALGSSIDLTGSWVGQVETGKGSVPAQALLVQEGEQVAGSVGLAGDRMRIRRGDLDGDRSRLRLEIALPDGSVGELLLRLDGDRLFGELDNGRKNSQKDRVIFRREIPV